MAQQWGIIESHVSISARHVMTPTLQICKEGMYDLMKGSGTVFHIEGNENIPYFTP